MGWLIDILPSLITWAVTATLAALCGWLKGRLKRQDAARQAMEEERRNKMPFFIDISMVFNLSDLHLTCTYFADRFSASLDR